MAKESPKKQEQELSVEELKKKLADLEAKLAEGDDAALKRVCKASGVDYDEVVSKEEEAKKPHEDLIRLNMGSHEVNVNGRVYRGVVEVPRSVAQVLNQAMGDKRMRHLRELVGTDNQLVQLEGGQFTSKVVGQVNIHGERIGGQEVLG